MEGQQVNQALEGSSNSEKATLQAFLTALPLVLSEVARTTVELVEVSRQRSPFTVEGVTATLPLRSSSAVLLTLQVAEKTARELAHRMLAEVPGEIDEAMVRDCAGELVNVIAGQAKAILTGTPEHFSISTPTIYAEPTQLLGGQGDGTCLLASFSSDVGTLELRLYLAPHSTGTIS